MGGTLEKTACKNRRYSRKRTNGNYVRDTGMAVVFIKSAKALRLRLH
jgi:hypothetical protein